METKQPTLFDEKRTRKSGARKTQSKDGSVSLIVRDPEVIAILKKKSQAINEPMYVVAEHLIRKGFEIEEEEIIDSEVKSMTREELEELAKQTMRGTRGASA